MTQAWNLSQLANKVNTSGQLDVATGASGLLPIANGGTNSSATATSGGVGYGTGTAHAYTAAGTAGQLLQSNGASPPTWVAPPQSGFSNMTVFTSPGTFTAPASTNRVKITIVGGGGGSSGAFTQPSPLGPQSVAGFYGGGGGYAELNTAVTAGSPYAITVGAGGTAGAAEGNGGDGGTSSFGALVSATGGTAGKSVAPRNAGTGGSSTGGQVSIPGIPGGNFTNAGGSQMGWVGQQVAGQGYGSSGGTPQSGSPTPRVGYAGASGVIIVEY